MVIRNQKNVPPNGGADLECLFVYAQITLKDFEALFHVDPIRNYPILGHTPFSAQHEGSFLATPPFRDVSAFCEWLDTRNVESALVTLVAQLFDQSCNIHIQIDLECSVLTVATREDMLWAYSNDATQADIRRLGAFFHLCRSICSVYPPKYAEIGTEPGLASEVVKRADPSFDHIFFFAESQVQDLFNWYVNVYSQRWDGAIKLNIRC